MNYGATVTESAPRANVKNQTAVREIRCSVRRGRNRREVLTIKGSTLGACLLLTCNALGAHTYKVIHAGATVADVADKLGISQKALVRANDLGNRRKLHKGEVLVIPSSKSSSHTTASVHRSMGSYVVHNGDCDWTVAHRFGLTVPQLKELNPGVDLSTLTLGSKLRVPAHGGSALGSHEEHKVARAGGSYTVKEDDNDWIVAKNVGTTPKVLRQLNPGVNLNAIHPGQKLNIPGSSMVASHVPAIHTRHAFIAKDDVVLRRRPSTDSEMILTVDAGLKVLVLDHEGSWYKLRFPKGTEAWVRGDNLKPAAVQVAEAPHHSQRVSSRGVSHHEHNARLAYLQHQERLYRMQAHSKNASMRHEARLTARRVKAARMAASMPVIGTDLIADAKGWIGTPYRYGAMSRGATDCSGYVGQIYRRHGIKLPRTSLEQSHVGQGVSKGDLKEGDLVFFRTRGSGRVSHVGMYVGGGRFIHASSGGGQVQVSSLSDSYYSKRFAGARRVAKHLSGHHSSTKVAKTEEAKPKDEDGDN